MFGCLCFTRAISVQTEELLISRKKGIGAALAIRLASLGYNIFITYYRKNDLDLPGWKKDDNELYEIIDEIKKYPIQFGSLEFDLTEIDKIPALFDRIEKDDRQLWVLAKGCQSDQEDAWKQMVQLVRERIANEELGYNECELILALCCNSGGPKETKTIGNLLFHYVEEVHPTHITFFVQISPSFIVDVYK